MSKFANIIKKAVIAIACILAVLIALGVTAAIMENRPFPKDMIDSADASLYFHDSKSDSIGSLSIRVTNKSKYDLKDLKIEVDILDESGNVIDGRKLTSSKVIPSESTRRLYVNFQDPIYSIPAKDKWSWKYKVLGGLKAWWFDYYSE